MGVVQHGDRAGPGRHALWTEFLSQQVPIVLLVFGLGIAASYLQHGFLVGGDRPFPLAGVKVPLWHLVWLGFWTGYTMALVGEATGIFSLPYAMSILRFDQVAVAAALLDAFEVTGEGRYLTAARELMGYTVRTHWDAKAGAFFDVRATATDVGPLAQPMKVFVDNTRPASNSLAAMVLLRLYKLTNEPEYRRMAQETLKAFAGSASKFGYLAGTYALAVDLYRNPPTQAVIIGRKADPRTLALWRAALGAFRPGKIVAAYDPDEVKPETLPPAVAAALGDAKAAGVQRAYVCVGVVCSLPSSEPGQTVSPVRSFGREGSEDQ